MSVFDVIFNRVEKFSSDANVTTQPDGKSTVVGPVHQADIARVEAESPEDAEAAVRVAYNASTSEVHVHEVPEVVDEPEPTTEAPSGTVTGQRTPNDPPVTDEVEAQADEPGDVPLTVENEVPAEAEPTESEVAVEPKTPDTAPEPTTENKPEVETTEPAEVA